MAPIDEEYRVEYALERANLIGGGFLAVTTGCARRHASTIPSRRRLIRHPDFS
jgi:hypothetical protein